MSQQQSQSREPRPPAAVQPVVVVGIDGSESSKDALRWALVYARLTGLTVHLVTTWEYPTAYGWSVAVPLDVDLSSDAKAVQDAVLAEVVGEGGAGDVVVRGSVLEGHPSPVLLHEAADATLMVLGSRGHGEFAGMLLGSVSQHCVAHSRCPVVVVPPAFRHRR